MLRYLYSVQSAVASKGVLDEATAGEVITPGDLLEPVPAPNGYALRYASGVDGLPASSVFALENSFVGGSETINDASIFYTSDEYIAGDLVPFRWMRPGDQIMAWLAPNQVVYCGQALQASTQHNGALTLASDISLSSAISLETLASGVDKHRIKVAIRK